MGNFYEICKLLRYYILTSITKAGSGHVTSSLSAVELMAVLFYKYFRFDLDNPEYVKNDRLIFSKGHASPLFYSLYKIAGKITEEEMMTLRKFDSVLEGHPTKRFKYTEVPTGSLGQGLSAGLGMALSAKMDNLDFLTYVLLGDGEMAEGQVWEAMEVAAKYKLNNLIGIVDVNRLGQSGETLLGNNLQQMENRIKSFGWRTYLINDGNNLDEVSVAYSYVLSELSKNESPYMIIAKTVKGKGVSFLENKEGWHGKALSEDECKKALLELGEVDKSIITRVERPESANSKSEIRSLKPRTNNLQPTTYNLGDSVATREAYGDALVELGNKYEDVVVLDGDVSNSTYSDKFKEKFPGRFFEMFIAEQNMTSVALGLSERGKVPYASTFSSFWTRALDQVRMAHMAGSHTVFCGSHAGVSIGEDGPSQMGLEDLTFFRTLPNTTIFYPSDAVSAYKLTEIAYGQEGIVYVRTTRPKTPVIYPNDKDFKIGGSHTLNESGEDLVTVISAGITLHEALKAYEELKKEGIIIRIIDLYSIKPIGEKAITKAAKETKAIFTVEDHYVVGGLGDAVLEVLAEKKNVPVYKLGVNKIPKSGKMEELLRYEEIDAEAIVKKVKSVV